ncbi:MAG: Phosphocholine transferase AnkX [Candidatus Anoxychlamydiales bacterium]|nr:Phosphocholine transferase AnkX [Candidatus Anoxychlamydiales bacterium]
MSAISELSARSSINLQTTISSEKYRDKRYDWGMTPLMLPVEIILELRAANLNSTEDVRGWTALTLAAYMGYTKTVQALVSMEGIDVNERSYFGKTALMYAAAKGHTESVQALVSMDGIDVNKRTDSGKTALMFAVILGHAETVDVLLQHPQIDINITDKHNGFTALMWAVTNNQIKIVKKLLAAKGVDVNKADKFDRTPLFFAAGMGRSEIDNIERGIDGNKVDKINRGSPEIVKILLKHRAYVDVDEKWINELDNKKIVEILRDAIKENDILIGKMKDIALRIIEEQNNSKSEGASSSEVSIDVYDRKFVQEEFDDRLYKLKKKQKSKVREIENKIDLINEKLKRVKDKTDVMSEKYQKKLALLSEQKRLYVNPRLRTFYFTINSLLGAKLISMMLLLGRVIKRDETKREKIVVGGVEIVTGALDAIPGGGALGNAIIVATREGMGKKNDKIRLKQAEYIQRSLGNHKGVSKFSELVARRVAQKFDEIIRGTRAKRVTKESAQLGGEKAVELIFDVINDSEDKFSAAGCFIKVITEKVYEEHRMNCLFEDKKEKEGPSKSLSNRVFELGGKVKAIEERQVLQNKQNQIIGERI